MDKTKRGRLESAGWKVGGVAEFLELPPEDALLIDIRARLAAALTLRRSKRKLTQAELAQGLPVVRRGNP